MRRVLVVALFALVGCTPTELQAGRYACERGEAFQCPGEWRCGLEGFCHELGNTTVAWRCETNGDCEGGFACGLTKSGEFRECHDPAAPQDWACKVPSDCLGGWQCGLSATGDSRQCHDPAAPRSFLCETASDCVGGWSCGLSSSREKRECHDPGNPRAFACADDTDCLSGWRCGTELLCVDPSTDQLGMIPQLAIDGGAFLNSLSPKTPVTALTVSPFYSAEPGLGRGNLAFVQDGRLHARSLDTTTGRFLGFELGTELPTSVIAQGARGTNGLGVLDEVERVSATLADGGLRTWVFTDGGFDPYDWQFLNLEAVNRLAHGSAAEGLAPSILAFNSTPGGSYGLIRGDFGDDHELVDRFGFAFSSVPNNRINAMTSLRRSPRVECVYLVDERGLYVSQRGSSLVGLTNFEPVSVDPFSHEECGGSSRPRISSVQSMDDRWLAVTAVNDGGIVQVAVLDANRSWTDRAIPGSSFELYCTSAAGDACDSQGRVRVDVGFGPCVACPAGTTFTSMSTVRTAPGTAPDLEVLCAQPSGPGSVFRLARSGSSSDCTRTLVTGESSFFIEPAPTASLPAPGGVAWSGDEGQIWFGSSSSEIASFTFDRPATGVVRRGPVADEIIAFTPRLLSTPSTAGLFSNRSSALSASVASAPALAVAGGQLIDLAGRGAISEARPLGFLPEGVLAAPTHAVLTRSGGLSLAVISGGTAIYAADLEAVLSGTAPPVALNLRINTGEPVSSLAFPKAQVQGAGPIASGYAVAGSNVVRIVADTLTRWRTEAVPLPAILSPQATWFHGTKARVGFHDGSVFSLPSRVRISLPLPMLSGEAVDYAQTCGQQLALARNGLYRLVAASNGGPVGHWEPVALPAQVRSLDFTLGRAHGVGNEVFVFTRTGEAARVTFSGCAE